MHVCMNVTLCVCGCVYKGSLFSLMNHVTSSFRIQLPWIFSAFKNVDLFVISSFTLSALLNLEKSVFLLPVTTRVIHREED